MSSLQNQYLPTLLKLREEYIEVDGNPADFDDLVNAGDELTTTQTSLCRWIFHEAYGMRCDSIGLEVILPRIADLVEHIPGFGKYEKEETIRMIIEMACVLPSQEITKPCELGEESSYCGYNARRTCWNNRFKGES